MGIFKDKQIKQEDYEFGKKQPIVELQRKIEKLKKVKKAAILYLTADSRDLCQLNERRVDLANAIADCEE